MCSAPDGRASPRRRSRSTRSRRRSPWSSRPGSSVPKSALAAAAGAILGHLYPVWLRFRGGKGVATFLGGLIGIAWPAAIVFALVWLAIAAVTRYSSAAALAATAVSPLVALEIGLGEAALVFWALAALVWFKHGANIGRLLNGSEPKIGQG